MHKIIMKAIILLMLYYILNTQVNYVMGKNKNRSHRHKSNRSKKNVFNQTNMLSYETNSDYFPKYEEWDQRALPSWYNSDKIGIFVKLELYLNKSAETEWFWYRWYNGDREAKRSAQLVEYNAKKAFVFKASKLDPDNWAQLFQNSGARYVVLAAKNRDGFALFPSGRRNRNSVDVGPKRDIVGIVSNSIRKYGMKFGISYCLMEGCNNLLLDDVKRDNTTEYTDSIVLPDIELLVNKYQPSLLWPDGDEDFTCGIYSPICSYWKVNRILAWLYNKSKVKNEIVVNDKWCNETYGRHGDFFLFKSPAKLSMSHNWEHIFPMINQHLHYRTLVDPDSVLTLRELLYNVVSTVSLGGNVLINVQPTTDGVILPIVQERLLRLGKFLKNNAEAIYDSMPWIYQRDSVNGDVWYTSSKNKNLLYVIFLQWPENHVLGIKDATSYITDKHFTIYMINPVIDENSTPESDVDYVLVPHSIRDNTLEVDLQSPSIVINDMHAWVLKIELIEDSLFEANERN